MADSEAPINSSDPWDWAEEFAWALYVNEGYKINKEWVRKWFSDAIEIGRQVERQYNG